MTCSERERERRMLSPYELCHLKNIEASQVGWETLISGNVRRADK